MLTSSPWPSLLALSQKFPSELTANAKDETIRTLQVEEFSKVDEQWILGGCSVRDEATRDADILRVTEAAVGLKFPSEIFQPESLTKPTALPLNFKKL